MRTQKEHIENRREALMEKPERELLADIMIALDGYSGRLERLSQSLSHEQITDKIKDITETTAETVHQMSENIIKRMDDFDVAEQINNIKSAVENIQDNIGDQYIHGSLIHSLELMNGKMDSLSNDHISIKNTCMEAKKAAKNAQSAAEDAESAAENAETAAWNAQSAAEDAESTANTNFWLNE